jgi:hypothetical protein
MDEVGGRFGSTERLLARHLLEPEREQDVFAHGHVGVERIGLEDDPDVAIPGLDFVDDGIVEQELSAARQIESSEHEEARRLAASGRAEQGNELTVLDHQVHVRDDVDVPEAFDDIVELDPCHASALHVTY